MTRTSDASSVTPSSSTGIRTGSNQRNPRHPKRRVSRLDASSPCIYSHPPITSRLHLRRRKWPSAQSGKLRDHRQAVMQPVQSATQEMHLISETNIRKVQGAELHAERIPDVVWREPTTFTAGVPDWNELRA
jgi:hypothetical protein